MAKILVETSARHLHLTQEDLETLFGDGFELTFKKALSQPGQFATNEKVEVIGPKKSIGMISVLGPVRKQTQVELSMTDARSIGIAPFVRESGDLAGTPGCRLVGPKGEIELKEGVIVAKRHIHFTPEDGEKFGVKDKQIVRLKIDSDSRSLVFDDVICRVSPRPAPPATWIPMKPMLPAAPVKSTARSFCKITHPRRQTYPQSAAFYKNQSDRKEFFYGHPFAALPALRSRCDGRHPAAKRRHDG